MIDRLFKPLKSHHYFLFGARGTGKSYLFREQLSDKNLLYIDLLNSDYYDQLSLRPETLNDLIRAAPDKGLIVLDEIQKIPALLDTVHKCIEENPRVNFIMTGSSARKLKRGGANMLAGRAALYELHPLTSVELAANFDLSTALKWGGLPYIWKEGISDEEREVYLRAYTRTYLKEEILEEQLIRKLEPFQRFLPIAAQCSGTTLNYKKIADDIGVAPQTVQSYFSILEDTLVGFRLRAYHRSIRKQERKDSKFYLFDIGVLSALERTVAIPVAEGTFAYGRRFEHFLMQEIFRLTRFHRPDDELYHYQTKGGREIDLVIDRPGGETILIEMKSKTRVGEEDVRHLNALVRDFDKARAFCLSRDPIEKKIGDTHCLSWERGLVALELNHPVER